MESVPVEEKKHQSLDEGDKQPDNTPVVQEVVHAQNKYIPNIASPFLKQQLTWEKNDEKFDIDIPEDIKVNIVDNLQFLKPSSIQSIAIPIINTQNEKGCYEDLIAQSKNGSGKTGAFTIASILRLDRKLQKCQILVIVNTRELCNQIFAVYEKLIKGTEITLSNFAIKEDQDAMICVSTHGQIQASISGRKKMDLKSCRCLVVDEADAFFYDEKTFGALKAVVNYPDIKNRDANNRVQRILFSATYESQDAAMTDSIQQKQSQIVQEAHQIMVKAEKLKLDHIHQCVFTCEPGKKLEFVKEIFETCETTQTYIFVNSKNFASSIHEKLKKDGLASHIMFSGLSKEERDSTMADFREQKIHTLICTDLVSRGIDVPEAELVINFDVPCNKVKGQMQASAATYLHRIGRGGRFGKPAVAITLLDPARAQDKPHMDDIIAHYKFDQSKITQISDAEHLKEFLRGVTNAE